MVNPSIKRNIYNLMKGNFTKTMVLMAIIIFTVACKSSDLDIDVPNCVENKIEEILQKEITNPPTQVWKWISDGKTYYYITSDCCDQFNYLFSENCEVVCAPDGGFSGQGDGNCPNFNNEIVKTLIWVDEHN